MRILHLLSQKPDYTGSGLYLRALLREANRAGHQAAAVVGLGPDDEPCLKNLYPVRFESPELPFPVVGMSDVMPYRSTLWSALSQQELTLYRAAFEQVVREAVEDFQPDVLHCHHLWVLTALVRTLYPRRQVVAGCHGTCLRQHARLPGLAAEISEQLSALDHVYFLTGAQKKSSGFPGPSNVVGAGFDSTIFYPGRTTPERRVLYAGKLSYAKGCRELLRAVQPDHDRLYRLSLAGAGHGEEGEALAETARAGGIELLGRMSQPDLAQAMRSSKVFVLPSYYEGLPLVLCEALACGCRVVANRLPGLQEWMCPELISSRWVRLVDMPGLVETDRPLSEELPRYVEKLRRAIREQIISENEPPKSLSGFLQSKSWHSVYRNIAAFYREGPR